MNTQHAHALRTPDQNHPLLLVRYSASICCTGMQVDVEAIAARIEEQLGIDAELDIQVISCEPDGELHLALLIDHVTRHPECADLARALGLASGIPQDRIRADLIGGVNLEAPLILLPTPREVQARADAAGVSPYLLDW